MKIKKNQKVYQTLTDNLTNGYTTDMSDVINEV